MSGVWEASRKYTQITPICAKSCCRQSRRYATVEGLLVLFRAIAQSPLRQVETYFYDALSSSKPVKASHRAQSAKVASEHTPPCTGFAACRFLT